MHTVCIIKQNQGFAHTTDGAVLKSNMTTILEDTSCSITGICKRNDVLYIADSSQFGGIYTVSVAIGKLSPVVDVVLHPHMALIVPRMVTYLSLILLEKKCTY